MKSKRFTAVITREEKWYVAAPVANRLAPNLLGRLAEPALPCYQ